MQRVCLIQFSKQQARGTGITPAEKPWTHPHELYKTQSEKQQESSKTDSGGSSSSNSSGSGGRSGGRVAAARGSPSNVSDSEAVLASGPLASPAIMAANDAAAAQAWLAKVKPGLETYADLSTCTILMTQLTFF